MVKQLKLIGRPIYCNTDVYFRGCLTRRIRTGVNVDYFRFYRDGFIHKNEIGYSKNENINLVMKPMELMLKMCKNASRQTLNMIDRYSFLINIDYHINRLRSYDNAKYKILNYYYQQIRSVKDETGFARCEKIIEKKLVSLKEDFRSYISVTRNIYNTNEIIVNTPIRDKIRTNSVSLPFISFINRKFPVSFREQRSEWFLYIIQRAKGLRSEKLKKSRIRIIEAMHSGKRMDREFIWNVISENFIFENTRKQMYKDVFTVSQNQRLEYLIRNSSDEEFLEFVDILKKEVNNYVLGNLKKDISVLTGARADIENRMDYSFEKSKSELIKMLSDMSIYQENEVRKIFTDRPMDNFDEVSLLQYAEFLGVMDKKINDVVNLRSNRKLMSFYNWLGDYDNNRIKSYATNIKKYNFDKRILFDRGVINYIYNSAECSDFINHELKNNDIMNRKYNKLIQLKDITYRQHLTPEHMRPSLPFHSDRKIHLLVLNDFPAYERKKTENRYSTGNVNIYNSAESKGYEEVMQQRSDFYDMRQNMNTIMTDFKHHVRRSESTHNDQNNNSTISELISRINEQNKSIEKLNNHTIEESQRAEQIKKSVKKISDRAVEEIGKQLYIDNIKKGIF